MALNLFSGFANQDKNAWKKKVERELGQKLPEAGFWKIADHTFLDPYYTSEEVNDIATEELRHTQRKTTGWLNTAYIKLDTPGRTNDQMRSALASGADGVLLDLESHTLPQCEFLKTLHAIRLSDSSVFFKTSQDIHQAFLEISRGNGYYLKGGFALDPIAQKIRFNAYPHDALESIGEVIKKTKAMKDFRPFMIESHIYHEGGADVVQELAFMTSALVSCVDYLTDNGIAPLLALNRFFFSVSIGTDHIAEIAKLRALRFLYYKITRAYDLPDALCTPFIHGQTSSFYHTTLMPHTNMIRVTSEAMSAVIGGCDALTVLGFDSNDDVLSNRIANNVSHMIAYESYIRHVADPAAGSYLIDKLSVAMADSAWSLFLQMEKDGGMETCHENGFVQSQIEKSWNEKLEELNHAKIMIGINKFAGQDVREVFQHDQKNTISAEGTIPKRNLAAAWLSSTTK